MDDNTKTTQVVGTGAPVENGIPDVDAAAKAQQQQQQQQQQPPRSPVDNDDNNDGTSKTRNNYIQESSTKDKNNTNRSRLLPLPSLQYHDSKRTTITHNNHNRNNRWELTPISLLLRTMGYMDNDMRMMMCLGCKQIKELIWNERGMETNRIRVFELRPSDDKHHNNTFGSMKRFLLNMDRYCRDGTQHRMLQGYQHWKFYNPKITLSYDTSTKKLRRLVPSYLWMVPGPSRIEMYALVNILALLVPN